MFSKNIVPALLCTFICVLHVCVSGSSDNSLTPSVDYDPHAQLLRGLSRNPDFLWITELLHFEDVSNRTTSTAHANETVRANDVSDQCSIDLSYLLSSIKEKWALQMLDSFGKPEAGVLYGRGRWPGSYEECLDVLAPPARNTTGFKGRYCWLALKTQTGMLSSMSISSGICIPSSCHEEDLRTKYELIISLLENVTHTNLNDSIPLLQFTCLPDTVKWSNSAIVYTTFLSVLTLLVLSATGYELFLNHSLKKSESSDLLYCEDLSSSRNIPETDKICSQTSIISGKWTKVILCFSGVKNGSSILDMSSRKGQLDCLHGIRFLSMAWVILGHTYLGGLGQITNPLSLLKEVNSFGFLVILQGTFSVDTFFLLSGFLLAYLFLKDEVRRMGVKEWAYFYIHRYLRLTPTYAFVIGIWASIWLYVGSGPFWDSSGSPDQKNCQTNWWQNLLYINNFPDSAKMCMAWSWYLANDMQFFVISPLFLVPLQRWPIAGCAVTSLTLVIHWITTGVISYQNKFNMLLNEITANTPQAVESQNNYFNEIYDKPYTRIGPYLIGILVAFAYIKCRNETRLMNKWIVMLGWACGTALSMVTIFGIYNTTLDVTESAFYYAFSRSAYALGVGWIIFACLTGHGGPVNWILSWKVWFPLSRLTYCAYLIHIMITTWYFGSLKDTYHFSHVTTIALYLAFLALAYAGAFLTSIVLESPLIALEKQIRSPSH